MLGIPAGGNDVLALFTGISRLKYLEDCADMSCGLHAMHDDAVGILTALSNAGNQPNLCSAKLLHYLHFNVCTTRANKMSVERASNCYEHRIA